ncbi:MAG: hypothetical protein SVN78_09815 [Deferribacterota bacterium]|nr:hypothetical protein [Deferribacterota bacterium]
MNIDPFASSTFSLRIAWFSAILGLICFIGFFEIVKKKLGKNIFMFVWFSLCLLFLSPARYMLFQSILAASYIFQSKEAFISSPLLALYIPTVFGILLFTGLFLPLAMLIFLREIIRDTDYFFSFVKGISAIIFPIICLISSYIFYYILPYAAWALFLLNPNDLIKATNGPTAIVYKYITKPLSPTIVPDIFYQTPQRDIDLLRCHVAAIYMSNQKFWYFVKLQYPDIYEQTLKKNGGKLPNKNLHMTTIIQRIKMAADKFKH